MSLGRISQSESGYSSIDTISLSMDHEDDTTCDSQQSTIKSIDSVKSIDSKSEKSKEINHSKDDGNKRKRIPKCARCQNHGNFIQVKGKLIKILIHLSIIVIISSGKFISDQPIKL